MHSIHWKVATLLAIISTLIAIPRAFAQQESTPIQIAGEVSALGLERESGTGTSGLGLRIDLRVTRRVEIDGRLTWFPAELLQEFQAQGGRTLQAAVGIRGKLFIWRGASVYGLLMPGVLHFTDTVVGVAGPVALTGSATHFALDTGIGIELYPASRWTVRGELTGPLYGVPGGVLGRSEPGPTGTALEVDAASRFVSPWQISAGVGYRIGSLRAESAGTRVADRWEAGGQLTHSTSTGAFPDVSFVRTPAVGAFVSYRIAPGVYADAAVNTFVRPAPGRTPFDGGYLLQGLGGVKLGVREDRYGIFIKTRAGMNSHSGALASVNASSPTAFTVRRSNATAIEVGGVVERYFGRGLLVRFDGGDVLSVYHATTFTENDVAFPVPAPTSTHSLTMTVGVGRTW